MTTTWAPIRYRDLWDVPRIFLMQHEGHTFLFDCEFDESTEDFRDTFQIYRMPELDESELAGSWELLTERALQSLGTVPVTAVCFDPTRRKAIDVAVLRPFLTAAASTNGTPVQLTTTERRKP